MTARAGLAVLALLLSGCVGFKQLPVASLACDPQLVGLWQPVNDESADGDKGLISIDADCKADFQPPATEKDKAFHIVLRGFALGDWHYLALSPGDVETAMGMKPGALATMGNASVLLRYRIDGDDFTGNTADIQHARSATAREGLHGQAFGMSGKQLTAGENAVMFIVDGNSEATAKLLRGHPEMFESDDKPMRLHRIAKGMP